MEIFDHCTNFNDVLAKRVEETPDSYAFVLEDKNTSRLLCVKWETHLNNIRLLLSKFSSLQEALASIDNTRTRIGFVVEDRYTWELVEKALHCVGAIPVPLDPQLLKSLWKKGALNVDLLVVSDSVNIKLPDIRTIVLRAKTRSEAKVDYTHELIGFKEYSIKERRNSIRTESVPQGCVVTYSSGTSGVPKEFLFSFDQLLCAAKAIIEILPQLNSSDRSISWLPLSGLYQRVFDFISLLTGSTIYSVCCPQKIYQSILKAKPTWFIGIPSLYTEIMNSHPYEIKKFFENSSLRFMITGSAPIDSDVLKFFWKYNVPLLEGYGISECIIPVSFNTVNSYRFGSVGKKLRDQKIKVQSDGRLHLESPGLALNLKERSEYRGKDLVYFDNDGFLYISGRYGDEVKRNNGRWLSLSSLSAKYEKHLPFGRVGIIKERNDLIGVWFCSSTTNKLQDYKGYHPRDAIVLVNKELPAPLRISKWIFIRRSPSEQYGEVTRTGKIIFRSLSNLLKHETVITIQKDSINAYQQKIMNGGYSQ